MEPLGPRVRPSGMTTHVELRRYLLDHDGVITSAAARDLGLDKHAVHRMVASGRWLVTCRGLYRSADHPLTARTRMRLATLSVGSRGVLSGHSAAYWHGFADRPPPTITVTAPPSRNGPSIDGVRVRQRRLDPADVVVRNDLLVCTAALAALEAGVETGGEILDAALLRRRVSIEQLHHTYERRRNHQDAPLIGKLLAGVGTGARSAAERETVRLLRRAGLRGWVANLPIGRYVVDLAFVEQRLIIEIDGMAYHRNGHAFQYDRTRRNDLVAAGWTVLNFTWWDVIQRPDEVIARIRTALAAAGMRGGRDSA